MTFYGWDLTRNFAKTTHFDPALIKRHSSRRNLFDVIYVRPEGEGATDKYFCSVEDLFRIKEPGAYTLRLRFKMFTKPQDTTNTPTLVTFPAMEFPIFKYE